jgi:hypothetical protein
MNIKIKQNIKVIILASILTLGASYVLADGVWTAPPCSPPGCNVDAPINVGASTQIKTGKLALGSSWTTAIVEGTNYILQLAGSLLVNGQVTINGPILIKDGSQGAGRYLMSNSEGLATWSPLPVNGDGEVLTFKSKYYDLMLNENFRTWFSSDTNGANLLKPKGDGWYNSEGWAFEPRNENEAMVQITADKLCKFFTNGGSSVSYTIANYNGDNNNAVFWWDRDNSAWKVTTDNVVDSRDISSVKCLTFRGINPNAQPFLERGSFMPATVTPCPIQKYPEGDIKSCPTR